MRRPLRWRGTFGTAAPRYQTSSAAGGLGGSGGGGGLTGAASFDGGSAAVAAGAGVAGVAAGVADGAADDAVAATALNHGRGAARALHGEALPGDELGAIHHQQRLVQQRKLQRRVTEPARRPEVEPPGGAVQGPLAGGRDRRHRHGRWQGRVPKDELRGAQRVAGGGQGVKTQIDTPCREVDTTHRGRRGRR